MAPVGGSIEEVGLDGRPFAATADGESQRKLGGFENEVQANGNGSARLIKTRVSWLTDGLALETDDSRGDQEYLQELANRKDYWPVYITYASGETYQGRGQIIGEMQTSSMNATTAVTLSGPGELTKQ